MAINMNTIPPVVFLPAKYIVNDDEAGFDPELGDMRMGLTGLHDTRDCQVCEWLGTQGG